MKKTLVKLCQVVALLSGTFAVSWSQTSPVPVNLGQDTTVCLNETLTLDASFPNCVYLWSTGETSATLTVSNFPVTLAVTVTDTTGTYDPGTDEIEISGLNIPPVALNPSGTAGICPSDSILLMGSFGGTSVWYKDGVAIPGPHTETYWASSPGSYNMTKTNLNGCTDSASVATVVEVVAAPTAAWTASLDSVDLGVSGEVAFSDNSLNASSWAWDFGDGGTSTVADPMHTYALAGTYTVLQTARNAACQDTSAGTIVVFGVVANDSWSSAVAEARIFPNPSSTYLNLEVTGQGQYEFELLSLWGEVVFKMEIGSGVHRIDLEQLPKGTLAYRFIQKGLSVGQGKLLLD